MGSPYFKVKERLNSLGVTVLSSNYSLYGDMSKSLMNLLKDYSEEIEIYSIDEAFVSIMRPKDKNLNPWARKVRCLIYQNLGITLTIGIGENKVRAKIANKLAKNINSSAGIFDLNRIDNENDYLRKISFENICGIGNKHLIGYKAKVLKMQKN